MRFSIILFLISGFYHSGIASGEWIACGGRSAGMGLSSAAVVDFWSITNNQAGMAFYNRSGIGLYYENRFMINEMASQTAAFTIRTKHGVIGATASYSGDASYNNTKAGLAYALKFGNRFSAGVQLDYIVTALGEDYGKNDAITFDAGIMVRITEQLTFGAHTFNPIHAQLSDYSTETIPAAVSAGLAFTFSDKLLLTAEAFKNSEFPMEFRSGLEYKMGQVAFVRIGLTSNPARYTFGFGMELKNLKFDLSSSIHTQLGYSPQASIEFSF